MLLQQAPKLIAPIFKWYPFSKGQWRLDQIIFKHISGYSLSKDTFSNLYLLDLKNCIDRMIYVFGSFEKSNIQKIISIAKIIKPDIFLDIGANIGVYTLAICRKTKIQNIHSFEPDYTNNLKLRTNLLINNMSDSIIVHNEALSDNDGVANLMLARDGDYLNMGKSSLTPQENTNYDVAEVTTSQLDSIFKDKGKTILIKIDIEGHEEHALLGMCETLKNNSVFLQIEIFPENYEKTSKILFDVGYSIADAKSPSEHDYYFTNIDTQREKTTNENQQ